MKLDNSNSNKLSGKLHIFTEKGYKNVNLVR